jgi:cation transport protein ChaC
MILTPGDSPLDPNSFWVFGYASLMWRPGFAFVEARPATLAGYRRDMCFLSIHYRGTPECPGLVCGLMPAAPEALCRGRAFRIAPEHIASAMKYLDERELITAIYKPRHLEVELDGLGRTLARVYIADTDHDQFAGGWSDDKKAAAILSGRGSEGRSLDYLASVIAHLAELGIDDTHLTQLLTRAEMMKLSARP